MIVDIKWPVLTEYQSMTYDNNNQSTQTSNRLIIVLSEGKLIFFLSHLFVKIRYLSQMLNVAFSLINYYPIIRAC